MDRTGLAKLEIDPTPLKTCVFTGSAQPSKEHGIEPTWERDLTSDNPEVVPTEEAPTYLSWPKQDIDISNTTEPNLSPKSPSTVPVRKWYQIDFNPAAFCKRVFQSVCSEPTTRSDSSAQKAEIRNRKDMIAEFKTELFCNASKDSLITGPPSIHKPLVDLRVKRGESASFAVHIIGFPVPEVSWWKDGKSLIASERIILTENDSHFSLTLVNAGYADNGIYACTARNAMGEVSCGAKLTVERVKIVKNEDDGCHSLGLVEWAECKTVMKAKRRNLQSLYEIHEEIGRGSFGIVKRATNLENGENYAAKFRPLRKGSRRRAFEERHLLSQTSNPRVASLVDSFCSRKSLVLLTELCSDHSLLDHLLSNASVTEKEVGMYIQQVLEGIEHIHSLNILHLNINPANILMTLEKEGVKICDFGFSQRIDPSRPQYSKYGTPDFVAPEIINQDPVTKGTDMWYIEVSRSFGISMSINGSPFYDSLTCHCPFSGESVRVTLLRVCEGNVPWDSPDITSRSHLAQEFLQMVLQPEPNLRPTAGECLRHEWFQVRGMKITFYECDPNSVKYHYRNSKNSQHYQVRQAAQESADINTKNLAIFISRHKLQLAYIGYGSTTMVLQTIADLLADSPQNTSLVSLPNEQSQQSSSNSNDSSSDHDEIDDWTTELFILNENCENRHLDVKSLDPDPSNGTFTSEELCQKIHAEVEAAWREDTLAQENRRGPLTPELTPVDSILSLGNEDEGSSGGHGPRESLIKSTFYSRSEELSPLSTRHLLLRQKKYTKSMQRIRACLRTGFSSKLGEPVLEDKEDSAEDNDGGSRRRGSSQCSMPLTKSCSFDCGTVTCSITQRKQKSRSFDEYSRKPPSTSKLWETVGDEDGVNGFSSQKLFGQDKKDRTTFSEMITHSEDSVMETDRAPEHKDPSFEEPKDRSSEFITDIAVEENVSQPTAGDRTEADQFECIVNDALCLSKDMEKITALTSSLGTVDGAINSKLKEDHQNNLSIKSYRKYPLISCVVDSSVKASERLDLENGAHIPIIHNVRSDEVKSKPSDFTLLVPEPVEKVNSAVFSISAPGFEDTSGVFESPSSKELDRVEVSGEIVIKWADSFQQSSVCAFQDDDICGHFPDTEVKPTSSVEDDEKVDSAEEVYPGLLEGKETSLLETNLSSIKSSVTNYNNEACDGAEAHPGIIVYPDEQFEAFHESMFELHSGKVSPYIFPESCDDCEFDLARKHHQEKIHTNEDNGQMTVTEKSGLFDVRIPGKDEEFLTRSGSLKVLHRGSTDIEEELYRCPSTPSLEIKTIPRTSGSIVRYFRHHSWTSQSSSPIERVVKRQASDGDSSDSLQQQPEHPKNPESSITKRVRASVSSLSKAVLGRQNNKDDKKESEPKGIGIKSSPPSAHGKSPETHGGSPKRSPGLFSFKFPGFKRNKGPVFLEELADQAVSLGQEVTLWCRLSGHPAPDVSWYKESAKLKTTDHMRLAVIDREYPSLTIYSAKEEDLGSYHCIASNAVGQVSTSCTLTASELPSCPAGLQIYGLQGQGLLLVWKPVESITELSYSIDYSRNGREWRRLAEGITDSYYTATNLARGAQYEFRVACLNGVGRGSFSEPSVPTTVPIEQQELLPPLVYTESTGSIELTTEAQFSLSTRHQTFSILSEINRGRFSVVKQCREDQSGQLLAAKITPFEPQWRQWALREYQLLRRLNHAHLVQLHVGFIMPCYLVLILELCLGQALFHHLAARDLYGEMHVQAFLQQIVSVTNYMHRRRVAHLDLKSNNILVTGQNVLKVVDLGSAHVFTPGHPIFTERLSENAVSKAPEVLEGLGVGPETDIWAIGVLAFTMLSADEPFQSESRCERERSVKKGKVQFGRCYSGISEGALNFMKKALNTKPQSRPSAAECLQMPWIRGARQPSKHRDAVLCFTTEKLRAYLQRHEPLWQSSLTKTDTACFH